MGYKPTLQQEKIINSNEKLLIVPASAGTGKTGVMTDRIARIIAEGEAELNEILVITFTKAAATEMKERLFDKLSVYASHMPELYRKLSLFDTASIGTIHSFCSELIKGFFYVADIDPSFSVMEDTQSLALKKEVLSRIFEKYHNRGDVLFGDLAEMFGKRTDEGLRDEIIKMALYAECVTDFNDYAERTSRTCTCEGITARIKMYEAYFKERADKLSELAKRCLARYVDAINALIEAAEIKGDFPENVIEAKKRISALPQLRLTKDEMDEGQIEVNNLYKSLKADWTDMLSLYINRIGDDIEKFKKGDIAVTQLLNKLFEIYLEFEKAYTETKYKRGTLDFFDLERLALKVLADNDAAGQIKSRYKYVFVDEYQDVNDVQERIVSEISSQSSLFLVGDIKQSIYGFRMSDPQNFVRRKNGASENSVVPLTVNFRSHKKILEFVNNIFGNMMTESFGSTDYSGEAVLSGERDTEGICGPVNILYYGDEIGEAHSIVLQIKKLLGSSVTENGKNYVITAGSIAVLSRTKNDLLEVYDLLRAQGIPVSVGYDRELYDGIEIRALKSLLKVIDNPLDDINLYASLRGYFGKLTENELCDIRLAAKAEDSLYAAAVNSDNEKVNRFFEFVSNIRIASASMTADKLISYIVRKTDYRGYLLTLGEGVTRCAVLDSFIASIEGKSESRELSGLLQYLEDSGLKGSVDAYNDGDSIKLMTIHSAKGLEFPVVFICALKHSFNKKTNEILFDKQNGSAIKFYDKTDKSVNYTMRYLENLDNHEYKIVEEELRLLYVALTRAKDMLFLPIEESNKVYDKPFPMASSMEDWVRYVIKNNPIDIRIIEFCSQEDKANKREILFGKPSDEAVRKLKERIEYRYPFEKETEVPVKVTATGIATLSYEAEDNELVYSPDKEKESSVGALLGTAYHKAIENMPILKVGLEDVRSSLADMVKEGKLTADEVALISPKRLVKALGDEKLLSLIEGARIYREQPFLAKQDFGELIDGKPHAMTIIQGVMDLIAVWQDRAVIVDFKYTSNSVAMVERYAPQLNAYKSAAKLILKKDNVKAYLYSLVTNELIEI